MFFPFYLCVICQATILDTAIFHYLFTNFYITLGTDGVNGKDAPKIEKWCGVLSIMVCIIINYAEFGNRMGEILSFADVPDVKCENAAFKLKRGSHGTKPGNGGNGGQGGPGGMAGHIQIIELNRASNFFLYNNEGIESYNSL